MKTLLSILFGAIIGYIGSYHYYHTTGKINITETKTITNIVSVTETQIVEQLAYQYITKTNEVWKTNIIEKIVQTQNYAPASTVVQKPVAPRVVRQQPTPAYYPATTVKPSTRLRGPTPSVKVKQTSSGRIKMGVKRNMDGSIKE